MPKMGIIVIALTLVLLLFTTVSHGASYPRVFLVGGSVGLWKVPDSPNNTLNHWAEHNRFKVGDYLVWKYDKTVDSVLKVTKEDYDSCNTTKPLKQYHNGYTKVKLDESGPYFFISGAPDNCAKGEKITLVVLSERKSSGGAPKASPISPLPPTTAPAHNAAVRLAVGNVWFWITVVIGLALALAQRG